MTVATTSSRTQFLGNDAATAFSFSFPYIHKSHLRVVRTDPDPDDPDETVDTALALDVDYQVTAASGAPGGTITYPLGENDAPLPTGSKLTVWRETPLTQEVDLYNGMGYDAEVIERLADTTAMRDQELADKASRAITMAETAAADSAIAFEEVRQSIANAEAALGAAGQAVSTANASDLKAAAALATAEAAVGTAGSAVLIAESAVSTAGTAAQTAGEAFSAAAAAELKAAAANAASEQAVASAGAVYELLPSVLAAAEAAEDAATTATTAAQQALAAAHTHGNMSLIMSFAEESGRLYYGTTGTATAAEAAAALAAATAAAEAAASKAAIDDAATSTAGTWSSGKISQAIAGAALPPATRSTLGGVIVGDGLDVSTDGTASVVRPALPVGSVFAFAGQTAPAHCLVCDGSAVSRTAYAALFAVIGTTYGEGDGETTFALPDLRGRFVEGVPAGGAVGAAVEAGLPNIEGSSGVGGTYGQYAAKGTGSITIANSNNRQGNAGSGAGYGTLSFSAAASNSIYGNSQTVQPPALTMHCVIVAE